MQAKGEARKEGSYQIHDQFRLLATVCRIQTSLATKFDGLKSEQYTLPVADVL